MEPALIAIQDLPILPKKHQSNKIHITISDHVEMFTDWGKIKVTDKTLIGNFNAREIPLLLFFY